MKKINIVIAAVLIIVGIGSYYVISSNNPNKTLTQTPQPTTSVEATLPAPATTQAPSTQATLTAAVSIENFSFNPSTLTIKPGTTVTWTNNDAAPHTVTSDSDGLLKSQTLSPGQSFRFTFANSGTTNYHCNIHPTMRGSIVVGK